MSALVRTRRAFGIAAQALDTPLTLLDRVLGVAMALALLLVAAILFFNALGRTLGFSYEGGSSLARLLVIWLTFVGSYLTARSGSHIVVDMVPRLVPARWYGALMAVSGTLSMVTTGYLAWLGYTYTVLRFQSGQMDQLLPIKTAHFYLPVPVGCGLITLAFACATLRALAGDEHAPERENDNNEGTL